MFINSVESSKESLEVKPEAVRELKLETFNGEDLCKEIVCALIRKSFGKEKTFQMFLGFWLNVKIFE